MPDNGIDEVLSQLSADEKKLFESTLQKHPSLKEGWLRQSDYSRKMTALQGQEKEYNEAKEYNERMKDWAEKNVPRYDALVKEGAIGEDGELIWPKQREALQKELDEAKRQALAGGDMDPAELDKRVEAIVKASGGVTQAEMKALIASEAEKLTNETFDKKYAEVTKEFNEKTIPFTTGFATSMALAAAKYERETGKEFSDEDTKAVFALMSKEQNFDPRKMVELYMKPQIDAKKSEEEVEKRAKEKADQMVKDRGGMPGSGDEPYIPNGNGPKGSLQKMLDASEDKGDIESQVMAAGREAAKELRAEGKS